MSKTKEETDNMFFIEKLRLNILLQLEKAVERHLNNEFRNKILPKMIKQIKNEVFIEMIETYDGFDITIKIEGEK